MKNTIASILAALICLFCLTGCGSRKTEEQLAREEIRRHLTEEAERDGFDLQAEIEKEAAEVYAQMESREQERAEKQKAQEDADERYDPLIRQEFDALMAASTYGETVAHAEAFNAYWVEKHSLLSGKQATPLLSRKYYMLKALYVGVKDRGNYANATWYADGTENPFAPQDNDKINVMLLLYNTDEGWNKTDCLIVRPDGGTCRLDLQDWFRTEDLCDVDSVFEDRVWVSGLNGCHLFDISGDTARLIESRDAFSAEQSDYDPHGLWTSGPVSDADFNDIIIRDGVGLIYDFGTKTAFGVSYIQGEDGHFTKVS